MLKGFKKQLFIYLAYLSLIAVVAAGVKWMGVSSQAGLWTALGIAALFAVFWPRW
ncbi:hypothetical protein JOC37_000652 [Desulfohalotomaculum tongense]|uniref:hypothetical protein n=1 Tax=Desulforadius tongensis TaxID=1216062 RepID=UPI00195D64BE|nr:hypothetical protein [Desulforadius tongensis]MBM7854279.1 hypothetical protein [Desulforadius tongensis]